MRFLRTTRVLLVGAVLAVPLALASPAGAHPLGNFTVSHYDGLLLTPDRLSVTSVVDSAEIPTQQTRPVIDSDDDGELSAQELASDAVARCAEVRDATVVSVDGAGLALTVDSAAQDVVPGAAALDTLRLVCEMSGPADLTEPAVVDFAQNHRTDRIGWREITARGDGVAILDPPVPATSVSDELRAYPEDLLLDPLDVRSVRLLTQPGTAAAATGTSEDGGGATRNPLSRLVEAGDARLEAYVGSARLTPVVGLLAVVLSGLLGAGHAMLPGHGKTVMAAYLAGRRGRRRDAVLVGTTVTLTHTVGVLVLGLVLTVASSLAGEEVLRYLGVVSGLLVVVVGAFLLRDALRERRPARADPMALTRVGPSVDGAVSAGDHEPPHDHQHHHNHGHHHGDVHGHDHGPGHDHIGFSRRSLIGIGVAGGLVPSPSALVVLLGAIALGRTVFGVLLVLAYGVGMAGVLTAVGLLLVHGRARLDRLGPGGDRDGVIRTVRSQLPVVTAGLVLLVGLSLVIRSLLA